MTCEAGSSTTIFSLSLGSRFCVLATYLRTVESSSCGDGSNFNLLECDSLRSRGNFLLIVSNVDEEDKYSAGVIFASIGFRGGVISILNEDIITEIIKEI